MTIVGEISELAAMDRILPKNQTFEPHHQSYVLAPHEETSRPSWKQLAAYVAIVSSIFAGGFYAQHSKNVPTVNIQTLQP